MAFKEGKEKTGGRQKGAKNKLTKTVKELVLDVFNGIQSHKTANLKSYAEKNPGEFYKIAAKLIPTEINPIVVRLGKDLEDEQYTK